VSLLSHILGFSHTHFCLLLQKEQWRLDDIAAQLETLKAYITHVLRLLDSEILLSLSSDYGQYAEQRLCLPDHAGIEDQLQERWEFYMWLCEKGVIRKRTEGAMPRIHIPRMMSS